MKSLTNYIKANKLSLISLSEKLIVCHQQVDEKLVVNKKYDPCTYHPKTPEELREIIFDKYNKLGPGTKQDPIDFNDIDVKYLDALCYSNEIIPTGVFSNIEFEYIDVSYWDVSNIKNMDSVFAHCKKLKEIELSHWDVSNVEDMNSVFAHCNSLEKIDLSEWDVSKVKNMQGMFYNCKKLTKLNISDWDVSNVEVMELMFNNCKKLKEINLSNWDISNAERINFMFAGCKEEIIPDWYKE